MDNNKSHKRMIFRCPNCLDQLIDVPLNKYEDGNFRCLKCGYVGNFDKVTKDYDKFKSKYKLASKRITLEEQREL